MPIDITDHPDFPAASELSEFLVEPVPDDRIERERADGKVLVETNLRELDELDSYVELNPDPMGEHGGDVGTALYRLTQLFGTPQFPEHRAGEDISNRTDTTFKYLFEVTRGDESGDRWLVTVFDWHVQLGVGVAAWQESRDEPIAVEAETAVVLLALFSNVVTEPVSCAYEDVWY